MIVTARLRKRNQDIIEGIQGVELGEVLQYITIWRW